MKIPQAMLAMSVNLILKCIIYQTTPSMPVSLNREKEFCAHSSAFFLAGLPFANMNNVDFCSMTFRITVDAAARQKTSFYC